MKTNSAQRFQVARCACLFLCVSLCCSPQHFLKKAFDLFALECLQPQVIAGPFFCVIVRHRSVSVVQRVFSPRRAHIKSHIISHKTVACQFVDTVLHAQRLMEGCVWCLLTKHLIFHVLRPTLFLCCSMWGFSGSCRTRDPRQTRLGLTDGYCPRPWRGRGRVPTVE